MSMTQEMLTIIENIVDHAEPNEDRGFVIPRRDVVKAVDFLINLDSTSADTLPKFPKCRYECDEYDKQKSCNAETLDGDGEINFCTRLKHHDGPHVACGTYDQHEFLIWED